MHSFINENKQTPSPPPILVDNLFQLTEYWNAFLRTRVVAQIKWHGHSHICADVPSGMRIPAFGGRGAPWAPIDFRCEGSYDLVALRILTEIDCGSLSWD